MCECECHSDTCAGVNLFQPPSDDVWGSVATALLTDNWKERIVALDRALEFGSLSTEQGMAVMELMVTKAALLLSDSHSVIVAKSVALLTVALRSAQRDDRFAALSKRLSLVLLDRLKVWLNRMLWVYMCLVFKAFRDRKTSLRL